MNFFTLFKNKLLTNYILVVELVFPKKKVNLIRNNNIAALFCGPIRQTFIKKSTLLIGFF
jgi:hypothetical protein